MRRLRRVKIVATLGPASNAEKIIEELARAGADVFRINMSHASHDLLQRDRRPASAMSRACSRIRSASSSICRAPSSASASSPKAAVQLDAGQKFTLDSSDYARQQPTASTSRIPRSSSPSRSATACCSTTASSQLKATKVGGGAIETEVIYGGKLSDKKGVSPARHAAARRRADRKGPRRSPRRPRRRCRLDRAVSFVQRPEDIIDVRKIVQGRAGVMAKIEKPQAVERLEEIIKLCDAFMIARGDLGVEMPHRAGAGPAKAHDPHRPPLRQAGGRRHPDARNR